MTSALVDLVSKQEHTPAPVAELLRYSIATYDDGRLVGTAARAAGCRPSGADPRTLPLPLMHVLCLPSPRLPP